LAAHVFQPLASPNVRRLVLGSAISCYGDALQAAAQAWLAVQLTHSARGIGLFALAWLLPRAAGSLVAGVLVDRHRRSTVLRIAVRVSCVIATAFLALTVSGRLGFPVLLALALCFALTAPFEISARNALLPAFVPREQMPAIIRLNFVMMHSAELLGLTTGGLLLATSGVVGCVALNLATSFAYLVLIRPLRSEPVARRRTPFWRAFMDGLRFVGSKRKTLIPLAIGASFAVLGFHFDRSTLPLFALEALHASPRTYGLLLAAGPLGAVLFLALVRTGDARHMAARIVSSALLLSVCLGLLALSERPQMAFVVLLAFGAAKGVHYSAISTLLQLKVPDVLRGRVFSFYNLAGGLFGLGGMAMTGLAPSVGAFVSGNARGLRELADPHGLRGALVIASVVCALVSFLILRPLRRIVVHTSYLHTEEVAQLPAPVSHSSIS